MPLDFWNTYSSRTTAELQDEQRLLRYNMENNGKPAHQQLRISAAINTDSANTRPGNLVD